MDAKMGRNLPKHSQARRREADGEEATTNKTNLTVFELKLATFALLKVFARALRQ
jgi:hypothetical protein